jgi:putative chitinase
MTGDPRMSTEVAVIKLAPAAKKYAYWIEQAVIRFGITTAIQKAHFLAQLAHESAGFTRVVENLNYRASGLLKIFDKYFNETSAKSFAHQPERIANRVYANRLGNGNEWSGDGWKYRGRGLIQLTGKSNYRQASLALFGDERLVINPDLVLEPEVTALVAAWFWTSRKINEVIDEDTLLDLIADNDDITSVTRKINGGVNGLDDRKRWLKLCKQCLTIS